MMTSVMETLTNTSRDMSRSLRPNPHSADGNGTNSAETFVFICEAVIIPIIFGVGIVTNCFSLVILPKSNIAATFKTCLIALTLTDLCAGLAGFTQMMVEIIAFQGHIKWGYYDERAVTSFSLYYIFSWFICTSAAIVIAIVVIRHYTISKPVAAKFNVTPRCARVACVSLLVVTFILFLPTALNVLWQSCYRDRETEVCLWINSKIPNLTSVTSMYLVSLTVLYGPILVIVYIGCMIGIRINLKRTELFLEKLQEENNVSVLHETENRQKTTVKITKTLLLIILLDTICCLPLVVQAFAMVIAPKKTVFSTTNTAYKVFDSVAEIFLVLRQAYNFWLYAYSHHSFRRRAKALIFCMFSERHREEWQSPASTAIVGHRSGRLGSTTTSCRLQSVDLDTDAMVLKNRDFLKGENKTMLNGGNDKKASVRATQL